ATSPKLMPRRLRTPPLTTLLCGAYFQLLTSESARNCCRKISPISPPRPAHLAFLPAVSACSPALFPRVQTEHRGESDRRAVVPRCRSCEAARPATAT